MAAIVAADLQYAPPPETTIFRTANLGIPLLAGKYVYSGPVASGVSLICSSMADDTAAGARIEGSFYRTGADTISSCENSTLDLGVNYDAEFNAGDCQPLVNASTTGLGALQCGVGPTTGGSASSCEAYLSFVASRADLILTVYNTATTTCVLQID